MKSLDFREIRGVVADMDGVLWRESEDLPGTKAFFSRLVDQGIPYAFATNNSTQPTDYFVKRLAHAGVRATTEQIITSSVAAAACLAEFCPPGAHVFVVGEEGIKIALASQGFVPITTGRGSPEAVVVGMDRGFDYEKLTVAANYIRDGAAFIATNTDRTFPVPGGLAPGAGSIVAAIETASDVSPTVIGKPEKPMFEIVLGKLGTRAAQTLMIGDRLETDILGAARAEMKTALVLTGVSAEQDIINTNGVDPDSIFGDLTELLEAFNYLDGDGTE